MKEKTVRHIIRQEYCFRSSSSGLWTCTIISRLARFLAQSGGNFAALKIKN